MESCIFCKIVSGKIPAKTFYEDEKHMAFLDINPKSKGHALLIPKTHYPYFTEIPREGAKDLFGVAQDISKTLKEKLGAKMIFLSVIGEEVPHTHIHLIPYYGGDLPFTLKHNDSAPLDEVLKLLK